MVLVLCEAMLLQRVFFFCLMTLLDFYQGVCGKVNKSTLIETIFSNYQPGVRPMCEDDRPVQLSIGIAVRQIIDLNEPRQILETNAWIRLIWNDCHIHWNATETGIKAMVLPYKMIWVPDITLYDNAENRLGGLVDFRPNVNYDGIIKYNFPSIIKSLCKVDVTFFPFDTQICKLQFGSWTHHGLELNLSLTFPTGDISNYVSNGEWEILNVPAIRHELYYHCCKEPYPDVVFYLHLKRKPLFYLLNLLFPCTLISTVAILGFLLPPDSGEKVSLEITVLLSLAVFLLVVSETMPPTSETFPFIGIYFASSMLLVSLSCLMTVTVLNLHFKGQHGKRLPRWMRKVCINCLGRLLRVKDHSNPNKDCRTNSNRAAATSLGANDSVRSRKPDQNGIHGTHEIELTVEHAINDINGLNNQLHQCETSGVTSETVMLLGRQLETLEKIADRLCDDQKRDDSMGEWKLLAMVIDRLFLVFFFLIQFSTTAGVFFTISMSSPATA